MEPEHQAISNLQERLIKEENRHKADDDVTSALAAVSGDRNARPGQKTDAKEKGNQPAHWGRRGDVECFHCHKKGHYASECRKRKRDGKNATSGNHAGNCAFMVTSVSDGSVPSNGEIAQVMRMNETDSWIIDSGASRHITHRREWFSKFHASTGETVALGDNDTCEVISSGTITIERLIGDKWYESRIENVLYVPKIRKNLFSVEVCTSKGYEFASKEQGVTLTRDNEVYGQGVKQNNKIYRMLFRVKLNSNRIEANVATASLKLWHERLRHVNKKTLKQMITQGTIYGVNATEIHNFFCGACQLDNGREYCNKEMQKQLTSRGILLETTAPYTPEQNGVAERDNRTMVESARTMLHAKQLPLFLWAEAISTAAHILN